MKSCFIAAQFMYGMIPEWYTCGKVSLESDTTHSYQLLRRITSVNLGKKRSCPTLSPYWKKRLLQFTSQSTIHKGHSGWRRESKAVAVVLNCWTWWRRKWLRKNCSSKPSCGSLSCDVNISHKNRISFITFRGISLLWPSLSVSQAFFVGSL